MSGSVKFTKVKWNGLKVELEWSEQKPGTSTTVEHRMTSYDAPDPELSEKFAAFVPIVLDLIEVPQSYRADFKVVGLSINEEDEDDRAGLVITCLKQLDQTNAPLVINTPHLREPIDNEEFGRPGFFTEGMGDALDEAQVAANAYLNGKRAQKDLFEKSGLESVTVSAGGKSVTLKSRRPAAAVE